MRDHWIRIGNWGEVVTSSRKHRCVLLSDMFSELRTCSARPPTCMSMSVDRLRHCQTSASLPSLTELGIWGMLLP